MSGTDDILFPHLYTRASYLDARLSIGLARGICQTFPTQFMLQGGDFTRHNGTGGESIYGAKFKGTLVQLGYNHTAY
jgi:hypothetical protein